MDAPALSFPATGRSPIASAPFAALLVILVEAMFFAALLSALAISRAGAGLTAKLPGPIPALVGALLLACGSVLVAGVGTGDPRARALKFRSAGWIAIFFLGLQAWDGQRWWALGSTPSNETGFFLLLAGAHALHVAVAGGLSLMAARRLGHGSFGGEEAVALRIFWHGGAGFWPFIAIFLHL